MFLLIVPETYTMGSLTLLVPLALAAIDAERRLPEGWYVAASAVSLSVTSTNWMSGLAAAAARWPWRRALQISVNAVCCVGADLGGAADHLSERPLLLRLLERRTASSCRRRAAAPGPIARVLLFHTIVMPHIDVIPEPKWGAGDERAAFGDRELGRRGALRRRSSGAALLAVTCVGLLTSREHVRARFVLGATLAGQVLLHLIYGEETFLYAMHVAPLLILASALAAASTFWRRIILLLAVALALTAAVNNVSQLTTAMAFFSRGTA